MSVTQQELDDPPKNHVRGKADHIKKMWNSGGFRVRACSGTVLVKVENLYLKHRDEKSTAICFLAGRGAAMLLIKGCFIATRRHPGERTCTRKSQRTMKVSLYPAASFRHALAGIQKRGLDADFRWYDEGTFLQSVVR